MACIFSIDLHCKILLNLVLNINLLHCKKKDYFLTNQNFVSLNSINCAINIYLCLLNIN